VNVKECLCGSGKLWNKCCGRFLDQKKLPKTPEQLMRSRYSAYAVGGYGDYLYGSWFPATAEGVSPADLSIRENDWVGLEVIAKTQKGDEATVEFKAYYRNKGTDESEAIKCMHERSAFKRIQGKWYYLGAELT
jgi:SEC-C motif-containing protein